MGVWFTPIFSFIFVFNLLPMKRKILNPYNKIPQHECFACSDHNPIGLKLKFYEEDEYVKANWKPL